MINIDFKHKETLILNIEIGKVSIPYDQWMNFFRIADTLDSRFNFYYYEVTLKNFLLDKRIITLESKDNDGTEWYEFKNYKRFLNIKDSINNLFELNYNDLNVDYRNSKISLIESYEG